MFINIETEDIAEAVMKNSIFWDKAPCSPLKVNRHLEGTYRLLRHGLRKVQQETGVKQVAKRLQQIWLILLP
jgi:hypothetical protein